jgi:hypothetical protein
MHWDEAAQAQAIIVEVADALAKGQSRTAIIKDVHPNVLLRLKEAGYQVHTQSRYPEVSVKHAIPVKKEDVY